MPLTKEEQAELDALQKIGSQPSSGLSAAEQEELRTLQGIGTRAATQIQIEAEDNEGVEIVSDEPPESFQANQEALRRFQFENAQNVRSARTSAIMKLSRFDRGKEIAKLPPLHLLEAVTELNPITDLTARRQMINLLERQGVPKSVTEEFVLAEKGPEGIKGLLKKEAIPTAFEVGGGLAGARVGAPIKGTLAGRAVGEAVQRVGERIFITERQKSIQSDVGEATINTALSGIGEFGSRKAVQLGAKILKPGGRTKKVGIDVLQETLQEAGERVTAADIPADIGEIVQLKRGGVGLAKPAVITPGEATNNALFATLDNISEKAVTSMQRVREGRLRKIVAFNKVTDDVLEEFAEDLTRNLTPAQLGGVLNDVIQGEGGTIEAARGIYRQFYSQLDDLGVGAVSNKNAKNIAQKLVDQVEAGKLLKGTDEGAAFIRNVADLADNSSFSEAITNRSQVLDWARRFGESGDRNAARLANELGGAMDSSMSQAAKSHSETAHKIWRRGNATFKAVNSRFDQKVISKLAKEASENPELAVRTIFKNNQPTRINKVKKILLSPSGKSAAQIAEGKETWKQLQRGFVTNIFESARATDGIVFGSKLDNALRKMGDEALNATFSPQQVARLKDVARLGKIVQGKVKGEGGMLIQLAQPAAVAGAVAGQGRGRLASIGILAAPPVWSRMALDPKMSKLLIDGLADIDKEGVRASTAAIQKLLRAYFREREVYFGEQTAKEKARLREIKQQQFGKARDFPTSGQQLRFGGRQF